ncbi:MAG: zinc ribbon domain-containing protein [Clostridia bacterium]|nr:zinc ribbon domain-containing protein [Clostridia bacterium]
MFFFKSKKINLKNLNDIMSSTIHKNIKFDTKIEIPENFIGLFYYKDKFILSLNSGEYKFQGDLFYKIVEKNRKHNQDPNKQPKFNFNLHYISLQNQEIEFSIKKFVSFSKRLEYTIKANYRICENKNFANEILLTWFKTTNERTLSYINNWFKDFLDYYLSKKYKAEGNVEETANKYFKKYGIIINKIEIKSNNNIENNFFNHTIDNSQCEQLPTQQINYKKLDVSSSEHFCSNCQCKLIEGSIFCHKCGYFNNKNS